MSKYVQFWVQKSPIFAVLGSNLNLSNLNKPSADDVFSRCWIYNDCILYGLRLLAWIISCPNGPKFPIFFRLIRSHFSIFRQTSHRLTTRYDSRVHYVRWRDECIMSRHIYLECQIVLHFFTSKAGLPSL